MGIFQKLKQKKQQLTYAKMLNGRIPIFTSFGSDIYASDVVKQAVHKIVTELMKLQPTHQRNFNDFDASSPDDSIIQSVLDYPNELMTTSDLISRIGWSIFLNYNAWIYPTRDEQGRLTGLYPISPTTVEFLRDAAGRLFVDLQFLSGYKVTIPYDSIIHYKYQYSVNDFLGGDATGNPDQRALLETLKLNHTLEQSVSKGLISSYAVNGVVKYNTLVDKEVGEKSVKDFEERLKRSEMGFLQLGIESDFKPFPKNIKIADKDLIAFVDDKILRHFGMNTAILSSNFTREQYESFYQSTLETIVIGLGQAFTKGIFSKRSSNGYKNQIVFIPEYLEYMTMDQKIEAVRILGDRGDLYENEARRVFGLRPRPELNGVRMMSLNYINVKDAEKYQLNGKTNKEEE